MQEMHAILLSNPWRSKGNVQNTTTMEDNFLMGYEEGGGGHIYGTS